MTIERKLTFKPEDIQAITFECSGCLSRLSVSPDGTGTVPEACPHCHESWPVIDRNTGQYGPAIKLLELLRRFRLLSKAPGSAEGFRILLEIPEARRED
jgi:hypothetical protein